MADFINLQPDRNDSAQLLLRKILAALNLWQGGVTSNQAAHISIDTSGGEAAVTVTPSADGTPSSDRVGGFTTRWTYAPAIDTNIYTAKDAVGVQTPLLGVLRKGVCTGILQSLSVIDTANQKPEIDFLFFSEEPAAATNNATYSPAAADGAKFLGKVSVVADDYAEIDTGCVATIANIGIVLKTPVSTGLGAGTVWVVPVVQSTPTFTASSVMFTFGVLQD